MYSYTHTLSNITTILLFIFFFRIRSLGTAALTLCYVAMGAVEAYHIEGIDAWDVAAGKLIIEEAGGIVIDTAGRYYIQLLCIIL